MKPSAFDFVGLAGFALVVWGIARVSISAALIAAGVMLFVFAFFMSGRERRGA